ncbi:DUF6191 domain-containing protein [Kitasatospora sp. NPDC092286]|uniref:DUF6191 domain-containing protein n=1 Tax=Kitasatospora sp. NPDC092286 TaxID=3364087 RepID=UPI00381FEA87
MVIFLIIIMVVERLWRWATKVKRKGTSISQAGLDEFQSAFQSMKRVQVEQQQTELMLRDEEGESAPPNNRIDLNSGKVIITPTDNKK